MKHLIIKPLLTEKGMQLAQSGWYSFLVQQAANKHEIIQEIKNLYKVEVKEIRTAMLHGKERRTGRKMIKSKTPKQKKAMVKLAK